MSVGVGYGASVLAMVSFLRWGVGDGTCALSLLWRPELCAVLLFGGAVYFG